MMLKRTSRACRGGWDSPDHVKVTGRAVELGHSPPEVQQHPMMLLNLSTPHTWPGLHVSG